MTQFLRDQASDSEEVVTPLMLDGTYLSRNFATLGPLIRQPPCDSFFPAAAQGQLNGNSLAARKKIPMKERSSRKNCWSKNSWKSFRVSQRKEREERKKDEREKPLLFKRHKVGNSRKSSWKSLMRKWKLNPRK